MLPLSRAWCGLCMLPSHFRCSLKQGHRLNVIPKCSIRHFIPVRSFSERQARVSAHLQDFECDLRHGWAPRLPPCSPVSPSQTLHEASASCLFHAQHYCSASLFHLLASSTSWTRFLDRMRQPRLEQLAFHETAWMLELMWLWLGGRPPASALPSWSTLTAQPLEFRPRWSDFLRSQRLMTESFWWAEIRSEGERVAVDMASTRQTLKGIWKAEWWCITFCLRRQAQLHVGTPSALRGSDFEHGGAIMCMSPTNPWTWWRGGAAEKFQGLGGGRGLAR